MYLLRQPRPRDTPIGGQNSEYSTVNIIYFRQIVCHLAIMTHTNLTSKVVPLR